jgi:hypothetical protein
MTLNEGQLLRLQIPEWLGIGNLVVTQAGTELRVEEHTTHNKIRFSVPNAKPGEDDIVLLPLYKALDFCSPAKNTKEGAEEDDMRSLTKNRIQGEAQIPVE